MMTSVDCPGSCADEEFHSCEECGVGLTSFSSFSVSPDACPERGCRDPALDRFFSQRCLGPGVVTDPFICPDDGGTPGCTINKSLVDNNVCDCPGTCADEYKLHLRKLFRGISLCEFVVSFVGLCLKGVTVLSPSGREIANIYEHIQLGHQPSVA